MRYYRYANKVAFNIAPDVSKHIERFVEFERKLLQERIFPRNYAFTVVHMLRNWVVDKKFSYLPVNVFLGVWAYNKYRKQFDSEYVEIRYDDEQQVMLLYDELNVARVYIANGGTVRLSKIVQDLRPLLSDVWFESYKNKQRPIVEAMDVLSFEYCMPEAVDYNDIIAQV